MIVTLLIGINCIGILYFGFHLQLIKMLLLFVCNVIIIKVVDKFNWWGPAGVQEERELKELKRQRRQKRRQERRKK